MNGNVDYRYLRPEIQLLGGLGAEIAGHFRSALRPTAVSSLTTRLRS